MREVVTIGGSKISKQDVESGRFSCLGKDNLPLSWDQIRDRAAKDKRDVEEFRAKAKRERRWSEYLSFWRNGDRLLPFMEILDELTDVEYWELLRGTWSGVEMPYQGKRFWLYLFTSTRGEREHLMYPDDRAAFDAMPDPITIYRGVSTLRHARGMSWTLNVNQAAWFAGRLVAKFGPGLVVRASVPKRSVLAYFNGRTESEIVIDPTKIKYEVHLSPEEAGRLATKEMRRRIAEIEEEERERATKQPTVRWDGGVTEEIISDLMAIGMDEDRARYFMEQKLKQRAMEA